MTVSASEPLADRMVRDRRMVALAERGHDVSRISLAMNVPSAAVQRGIARVQRAERIIALRRSGSTLESIAQVLGITRERVRQIEAQFGGAECAPTHAEKFDVLAPLALIRERRDLTALTVAARETPCDPMELRTALVALGMMPAIERLFEWRKRHPIYERRAAMVQIARSEAIRLHRVPSIKELAIAILGEDHGTANAPILVNKWNPWAKKRAGLLAEFRVACGFPRVAEKGGRAHTTKWFGKQQKDILAVLADGRAHGVQEIADKVGRTPKIVGRALWVLSKRKTVRGGRGRPKKWWLTG